MKIRKAKLEDLEKIMKIIKAAIIDMENEGIHQWDDIYPDKSIMQKDIEEQTLYVITDDDMIKAFITLNFYQPDEYKTLAWQFSGNNILVIHRLCVDPECKGHGIAKMLMDFAYKHAVQTNCSAIRLDAFPPNKRAIKLYEGYGYSFVGTVNFRKGPFNCYEKSVTP